MRVRFVLTPSPRICLNYRTDVEGCRKVLERSRSLFKPGYLMENEATFKSALRPLSADDLPLIGKRPRIVRHRGSVISGVSIIPLGKTLFPNLYIISGHGSKGWTLSFGSMRMMADIALGNETEVRTNDHGSRGDRLPISFNLRHFGFALRSQIDSGAFCPTRFHPIRGRLNRS